MAFMTSVFRSPPRWLSWAVNLLALVFLAYSLGQWIWRGRGLLEEQAASATRQVMLPEQTRRQDPRSVLRDLQLFGATDGQASEMADTLPVSGLDIVLSGVMVRSDGDSLAVLSVGGQPAVAYAVGQELLPGVSLHEIRPDHLVVRRQGGIFEIVPFRDSDQHSNTTAAGDISLLRRSGP